MTAARVADTYEPVKDLPLVQPLEWYIRQAHSAEKAMTQATIRCMQGTLHGHTRITELLADFVDTHPPPLPQEITEEQARHAHALTYWGRIHNDPLTAPANPESCVRALEMYLRFGFVMMRKRTYVFKKDRKDRQGKKKTAAAQAKMAMAQSRLSRRKRESTYEEPLRIASTFPVG
jgi:hypothetical protein